MTRIGGFAGGEALVALSVGLRDLVVDPLGRASRRRQWLRDVCERLADPDDLTFGQADSPGDLMMRSTAVRVSIVGEQQDSSWLGYFSLGAQSDF